jgi:hypothetical protein
MRLDGSSVPRRHELVCGHPADGVDARSTPRRAPVFVRRSGEESATGFVVPRLVHVFLILTSPPKPLSNPAGLAALLGLSGLRGSWPSTLRATAYPSPLNDIRPPSVVSGLFGGDFRQISSFFKCTFASFLPGRCERCCPCGAVAIYRTPVIRRPSDRFRSAALPGRDGR